MPPIRALVFDTFGTVVDWRSGILREAEALGHRQGVQADWAALADAWRAGYDPAMAAVRRGERPFVPLDTLHREILDRLRPRFGLQALPEPECADVNLAWHRLDPWPDAVPGLQRLRRIGPIAPLSNGGVALLLALARRGGLPWDAIFSAEMFGHYKPDAQVYLGACRWLALPPAEVLMVAAHPSDLHAAARCGLRTAFVARPREHGPEGRTPVVSPGEFDFAVADFLELADRLGA